MSNTIPESFEHREQLRGLIAATNRLKVMLWAGDLVRARQEIGRLFSDGEYGHLIERALDVKSHVISINRRNKDEVERELGQSASGWELEYLVQQKLAELSDLDPEEAELFAMSPVASLVEKFDRRISEETGLEQVRSTAQPDLFTNHVLDQEDTVEQDAGSGFRYSTIPLDAGQAEVRAYRLDPPTLDTGALQQHTKSLLGAELQQVEEVERDEGLFWGRLFLPGAFVEMTIYDPGRISLAITYADAESVNDFLGLIFDAIAKSQVLKSP